MYLQICGLDPMVLMVLGEICHPIHRYGKANNKYMKNYEKSKESLHLKY